MSKQVGSFRFLLVFYALTCPFGIVAQFSNFQVTNYAIDDYRADNQNWGIDIDKQGVVYVANNKGLLSYNGQQWQLYTLPNKTIVRSVLVKGTKIFTGSYEEFGYWQRDDFGVLVYHSLSHLIKQQYKSEEFWQIISYQDMIVFRSFSAVYVYQSERITKIPNSANTASVVIHQGCLLITRITGAIEELKDLRLFPYELHLDGVTFKVAHQIAAYTKGQGLFIHHRNRGAYVYDGQKIKKMPPKINQLLEEAILNKIIFLDEDTIAFGTIRKGVLLYDLSRAIITTIGKAQGLFNNTILGLQYQNDMLWCGLDNGIAKIRIDDYFQFYKDRTGVLGMVYDVVFFEDGYYVASNTGVYFINKQGNMQLIDGSEGHTWKLTRLGNQLLCAHNKKSFYIENKILTPIDTRLGAFAHFPIHKDTVFQASYYGLGLLTQKEGQWHTQQIAGLDFPVNHILFESDTVFWLSHPYKGVYRMRIRQSDKRLLSIKPYQSTLFKQYKVKLLRHGGKTLFCNGGNYFFYDKENDSIAPYPIFSRVLEDRWIGSEAQGNWFINKKRRLYFLDTAHRYQFSLDVERINTNLVSGYEKIKIKNDSIRMLNLNEGFVEFNTYKMRNRPKITPKNPILTSLMAGGKRKKIATSFQLSFSDSRDIVLQFFTPGQYENRLLYDLKGSVTRSGALTDGVIKLEDLPYGTYELTVTNDVLASKSSQKVILDLWPPWYWLLEFRLLYLFVLLELSCAFYLFFKRKQRRKQLALQNKNLMDTQKKIALLKQHQMEKEIKDKQKELIATADILVRKNEMLMVLFNELERVAPHSKNMPRTQRILQKSKKDIKSAKYWEKIFENRFEDMDREFVGKLRVINPKLTTKDLRLCIYIKNGLTSKKIAPLMGISIRGVELHRYRLRKKLNINLGVNMALFFDEMMD